jgi:hypothetical protein
MQNSTPFLAFTLPVLSFAVGYHDSLKVFEGILTLFTLMLKIRWQNGSGDIQSELQFPLLLRKLENPAR